MSISSGHSRGVPFHKHLTRRRHPAAAPSLKKDAFVGSIRYYDGQVDDAKYVANLIRTAAHYGAHAVTRWQWWVSCAKANAWSGPRWSTMRTATQFKIRAKQVINATGVWTDETQAMVTDRGQLKVRASKGIHLVVPRDRFQSTVGLILRTEKSVLFVIPWGRHWIIGTTDTDWNLDKAHPAASSKDIDYILDHVNQVLKRPLTREDVEGVYAGLRPLLAGENDSTAKLSREHVVAHPVPGLVVVAGGKWTTYRVMAKDAVDEATRTMDERVPPSCTETIPLLGAERLQGRLEPQEPDRRGVRGPRGPDRAPAQPVRFHDAGGAGHHRREPALAEPLPGADDYLQAEAVYAATHEGARHVTDVLTRRTRISIESWDRGVTAVPVVAKLMGEVLGWSDEQREREITHYIARVEAERLSQQQPDDESADAARLGVDDIVPLR